MSVTTRVVLVRHAEPHESTEGRCYGRLDVPLSAGGRATAEAVAAALEPVALARVYSSPLRRALETATPIARTHGLVPIPHEGLRELDFGELEGQRYEEIAARSSELFRAWMTAPASVRFPGGESFSDLRARALAAAEELRRRHRGDVFALVAHGGVTRTILADALGVPARALFRIEQSYGAVSVVDWLGESPVVRSMNVTYTRGR
jgi:2,3-bisphosphoglycerate-dependent phosphoglycerate mutase